MESQPPKQPIVTITESATKTAISKTLETTLQNKQKHRISVKNLSQQVGVLTKHLTEVTKKIEKLEEDFQIHEEATDKELDSLDGRCLTIEMSQKGLAVLKKEMATLNTEFTKLKNTNNQFSLLENSLLSSEKTIIQEKPDKNEKLLLQLKDDQAMDHALLLMHMESYATTDDKINKQEEALKQLEKNVLECWTLISDLTEGINKSESLNKQANLLLTEAIVNLKNNQSSHTSSHTESDTKTLETINSMLKDLGSSIDLTEKRNTCLETIVKHQAQSISTLQRWLMTFGGGSAIALAIWLWHYTHK